MHIGLHGLVCSCTDGIGRQGGACRSDSETNGDDSGAVCADISVLLKLAARCGRLAFHISAWLRPQLRPQLHISHNAYPARAQEAAENDDLGELPYKVLNAGLAGAGALHLAVLLPAQLAGSGGPLTPLVLGTWVAATALGAGNLLRGGRN
jgi:hypothetical protein